MVKKSVASIVNGKVDGCKATRKNGKLPSLSIIGYDGWVWKVNHNDDNDGNVYKDISVKESTSQSPPRREWKKCPVVRATRKIPQKAKPFFTDQLWRTKRIHTLFMTIPLKKVSGWRIHFFLDFLLESSQSYWMSRNFYGKTLIISCLKIPNEYIFGTKSSSGPGKHEDFSAIPAGRLMASNIFSAKTKTNSHMASCS